LVKRATVKSLPAETRVQLADGRSKPIADVRVGDRVLSTNPDTVPSRLPDSIRVRV
jgi:hypothetical protein